MSTVVDNRVVEMQFDNKQFESATKETMSTLEKLKEKLKFSNSTAGLDKLTYASKNSTIATKGIGDAVSEVRTKFSALQVAGVTAVANITNSAVNAGKRIASALTIDPVKTGFQEYETQINAVQTILANTQQEGTNLQQVNSALDDLNHYADKTIYNFTEMTRNIGTFTAAGVDLQTSVDSIKGIANLAAVSGSTSTQASTAMYQLSQALAAGKVSLMDWNSVVNAGMGGEVFQNALIRTSELLGTGAKNAIKSYGSFRESLTQSQWLTTEVLTETLKQFAGAYDQEDLIAQGYSKKQAKSIAKMAKTAEDAATKVKTFTQLWDTLKESAQSGWTQSWETIVGDFDEAKATLTDISDTIGGIIQASSDARNKLLSGGLSSGWKQLLAAGIDDEAGYIESIEKVAKKSGKEFSKIVKTVEADGGSFSDALKQGLEEGVVSSDTLTKALFKLQKKMSGMSEEERDAAGYSSDMISNIEALASSLKDGSVSMEDFTNKIIQPSGRENIIEAVWNSAKALMSVISPIKEAFRDIFPAMTGDQLYNITAKIREFTETLGLSSKQAEQLKTTFEGVFSIAKVGVTIIAGGLKGAFAIANNVIRLFNAAVLAAGDCIGGFILAGSQLVSQFTKLPVVQKAIQKVSDALDTMTDTVQEFTGNGSGPIADFFNDVRDGASSAFEFVRSLATEISQLDRVQKAIEKFKETFSAIKGSFNSGFSVGVKYLKAFVSQIKNLDSSSLDKVADAFKLIKTTVVDSLKTITNSIKSADFSGLFETLKTGASKMLEAVKTGFGGLRGVLSNGKDGFVGVIATLGEKIVWLKDTIVDFAKEHIDWNVVLGVASALTVYETVSRLLKLIKAIYKPINNLADILDDFLSSVTKSLNKFAKAKAFEVKTKGILNIAKSIALVAASIFVLAQLDVGQLEQATTAVLVVTGALAGLAYAASKLKGIDANFKLIGSTMKDFGKTLIYFAVATKMLGSLDTYTLQQGVDTISLFLGEMAGMMAASKLIGIGDIAAFGKMMKSISASLILLSIAVKLLGGMDSGELQQGANAVGAFFGVMILMMESTKSMMGDMKSFGKMMLSISAALILLSIAVKQLGELPLDVAVQGGIMAGAFIAAMVFMMSKMSGKEAVAASFGQFMLKVSESILIMAVAVKLLGGMSAGELAKGIVAIAGISYIIAKLMEATQLLGKYSGNAGKAGAMMIAFSAALLLMTASIAILSMIDAGNIAKAELAIAGLAAIFSAMMYFSKYTGLDKELKSTIIPLAAAVAILAVSLAALSMIDMGRLFGAATAMSMVMGVFAIVTKSSKDVTGSVATLAVLVVAVGTIAAVLYILSGLPTDDVLTVAVALSTVLLAVAVSLKILSTVQSISISALASLVVMIALAGLIGVMLSALTTLPMDGALKIAESLSIMILSLSAACVLLAAAGSFGEAGFVGVGVLVTLIAAIGGVCVALGALNKKFPQLEEFLDSGIPILRKIGSALGTFLGGIAGSFIEGATSGLSEAADNLSEFMEKLQPFLNGMKSVDESTTSNMKNLGSALKDMATADLVSSIASIFGGGDISEFAEPLGTLAESLKKWKDITVPDGFSDSMKEISNGIKEIGFLDAAKISAIGSPLTSFSKSIERLGTIHSTGGTFKEFCASVSDGMKKLSDIDRGAVLKSSDAIKTIASAANKVSIVDSAGIKAFVNAVNSLNNINVKDISISTDGLKSAVSVVKSSMSNMAEAISSSRSALTAAMRTATSGMQKGIRGNASGVLSAIKTILQSLVQAIISKKSAITQACVTAVSGAASGIRGRYSSFYGAGSYLGIGLVNGIKSKYAAAYNAGLGLGKQSAKGTKDGAKEQSPSKLTYQYGIWLGEGLINGIVKMGSAVYAAGHDIGETGANSVSEALSGVSSLLESGLENTLTITPVVDLSNVKAGANSISGMFSGINAPVGVMMDGAAINSGLASRQNGTEKLISAISELQSNMAEGTSTNVTVNLDYNAGEDANAIANDIAMSLRRAVRRGATA